MKKTIFATACVFALSTAAAFAQPSQAQGGGQTGPTSNSNTSSGSMMNNTSGMSNSTSGSTTGMSSSNMDSTGMNKNGVAANPSSQGNVGPGTTPGNPGSSAPSR